MPTSDGVPQPDQAASATKMAGGGLVLSPLPLGGGKRRKSRRVSKKVVAMMKKMGAAKIAKLRIFKDDQGKMNLSVKDAGNAALIVSQFTLAADLRGNRPGFSPAAAPDEGKRLYDHFTTRIAAEGIAVQNGIFGADMDVSLVNQGPVTIWLDTDSL
jgi:D-tyrosyl-tRNA(Tyr) deacylase